MCFFVLVFLEKFDDLFKGFFFKWSNKIYNNIFVFWFLVEFYFLKEILMIKLFFIIVFLILGFFFFISCIFDFILKGEKYCIYILFKCLLLKIIFGVFMYCLKFLFFYLKKFMNFIV